MTNYNSNDNRFDGRCFLEDVEIKLQKRLEEIGQSLSDGQKEIDNMQEYYWENYTEMDEYGYEDYDNQQALLHQVNANNEKLQLKHRFEKMLDAPFFGRVDFMYDGDDEPEPFYIGIGNFAEKTGMQPLIYDWRAPVSSLFYDYDKGPASYEAPAGSGKTSIALHRIAYLLYHERDTLKSSNILILSPNSVFADYISHILPELGEENIREMSFDLYAYKELRKGVAADCEDRYDQLERRMKFPDESAQNRFDWKQSKDFIGEIEGFLAILEDRLMEFKEIEFRGMTLTEEDLIQLFYYKFTETPLLKRMDAVKDYFIDSWETLKGRNISEDDQEMLQMKFDKMYTTKDIYTIYNWMLDDCGCDLLPEVPYEKRKLPYEDVFPMLYLKYRLSGGNSTHKNIKHLVIDEMQDYTYLQYTILESLFHCRMTILGDRAQTLDTKQQDVLRFLPKLLGREIRTIEIKKSYRNTLEIARYAEKVSGVSDLELLDRHGKEVVEKTFNTDTELLDELVCHLKCPGDFETAALITTTEEEAFDLSRLLKLRGINVSYVDRNSSAFKKGLTVTTFYLAKGLEFDQVFALRGAKENPLKNQAEYICATRALHELYVYEIADSLSK